MWHRTQDLSLTMSSDPTVSVLSYLYYLQEVQDDLPVHLAQLPRGERRGGNQGQYPLCVPLPPTVFSSVAEPEQAGAELS